MTQAEQTAPVAKTVIRPNVANMVRTAAGSFHKDDFIGNALSGLNLDQVKSVAKSVDIDPDRYTHLNVGQQRMCLGNNLRRVHTAAGENTATLEYFITEQANTFRAENEQAAADAAAAAEQAKADKKAAAAAAREAKKNQPKQTKQANQAESEAEPEIQ